MAGVSCHGLPLWTERRRGEPGAANKQGSSRAEGCKARPQTGPWSLLGALLSFGDCRVRGAGNPGLKASRSSRCLLRNSGCPVLYHIQRQSSGEGDQATSSTGAWEGSAFPGPGEVEAAGCNSSAAPGVFSSPTTPNRVSYLLLSPPGAEEVDGFLLSAAQHPNKETPLFPSEWVCLDWGDASTGGNPQKRKQK